MPDPVIPTSAPGPVQIGSYRIVQELGTGGMSSVFRAVHVDSGHEVALKVLSRSLARNSVLLQRFLREAKSAESLEHPNIVAIYDRGSEQGRYYLVLEYVRGGDLHERVRDAGPLPVAQAVSIVKGVVNGLDYAARRGLIHRDIKPANILLTPDGQPKVADLGLAVQLDEEDERVTRDGTTVGTVDYMSPEQARDSRATSVRSDIYSLGCTFYHILTGSAPFPGGDVTDKLRRHAAEPPPDVRRVRPDVPEAVARLIQRMMAKKPEARFRDYDELAAALEALPALPDTKPGEPIFALIDDEGDDEPDVYGSKSHVPVGSTAEGGTLNPPRKPARREPEPVKDFRLADLAALDDGGPAERPVRAPRPVAARMPAAPFEHGLSPAGVSPAPHRVDDTTLKDLIIRGILIGVAIVLVGFGLVKLITMQLEVPEPPPAEQVGEEDGPEGTGPEVPSVSPKAKGGGALPAQAVTWVEPPDRPARDIPPEPALPVVLELDTQPSWAESEPVIEGTTVTVRRVDTERGRDHAPNLDRALELPGGTIELADRGPFFVSSPRLGNRSRRIRARNGMRATLAIEPPSTEAARGRTAVFVVDGPDLVLEGLDLVVPVGEMPEGLDALIQCRSGSVTLRDCTVTLVGPPERPFTAVRLGESGVVAPEVPPRLRLERSLVLGPAGTAVELAGKSGWAWLSRSVVLGGAAPPVAVGRSEGPMSPRSRELVLLRSVLAGRRAAIDAAGVGPGGSPLAVRAAGSTLARVQGGGPSPLITTRGDAPRSVVEWSGNVNTFAGWSGWLAPLSGQGDAAARVAGLAAAQELWKAEADSHESSIPWADPHPRDWTRIDVEARAPKALATVRRVAWPEPRVVADTFDNYDRLDAAGAVPAPDRSVIFNAQDPRWGGDLGRFVAEHGAASGLRWLVIEARGQGTHPLSPICMPDGVSLSVTVPPPAPGGSPLIWSGGPASATASLFAVKDATLALTGVRLVVAAGIDPRPVISVDEGDLRLSRCVIREVGGDAPEARGGPLIRYRAARTRALGAPAAGDRPALAASELPSAVMTDCVLISAGRALAAEVGCAVVALRNCAVVGAESAVELLPQPVARDRFRADLQLDRCTLAAGRGFLRLGPWAGSAEGPARPWLVSGDGTAYLDAFDHGDGPWRERPVLLRADPEAMARGALSWQGKGEDYQVQAFLAPGDGPPQSSTRPDVQRDWVAFWGEAHIDGASGPARGEADREVRLKADRLKPGQVAPTDLAVESAGPDPERPIRAGADLGWLSATAEASPVPEPAPVRPKSKALSPGQLRRLDGAIPF
jgi:serine/threonine-protein kinase